MFFTPKKSTTVVVLAFLPLHLTRLTAANKVVVALISERMKEPLPSNLTDLLVNEDSILEETNKTCTPQMLKWTRCQSNFKELAVVVRNPAGFVILSHSSCQGSNSRSILTARTEQVCACMKKTETLLSCVSRIRGAHFTIQDGVYLLRASNIDEMDMLTVIGALEGDTSVTNLDLANNNLTKEAVLALAKVVAQHPTLLKLDISYNSLKKKSTRAILDAVKANKRLLRVKVGAQQQDTINRQIIVNHWPSSHLLLPRVILETCNMLNAWTARGSINLCPDTCKHVVRHILNEWVETGPGCPDLLGEYLDHEVDEFVSWYSDETSDDFDDFEYEGYFHERNYDPECNYGNDSEIGALYCMYCLDFCTPYFSADTCRCDCSIYVHTSLEKFWLISNIRTLARVANCDTDTESVEGESTSESWGLTKVGQIDCDTETNTGWNEQLHVEGVIDSPKEIWEIITVLFVTSFPVRHFWNPATGESRHELTKMAKTQGAK